MTYIGPSSTSMYPASTSSTLYNHRNSHHMRHSTKNELNPPQYSSFEGSNSSEISSFSLSSSPMSSPALYPRPRPSSPSIPTYHHHHSQFSHPRSRSTYLSPGYSRSSPYARRLSSPLTSSSSPPPATSPLLDSTRFDDDDNYYDYPSRVQIVGRDTDESYLFCDAQYSEDSRYISRIDEYDSRPKLPSFRSLFGEGEPRKGSPMQRKKEDHLYPSSSSMSSSSFEATLPPLKFLPMMRSETIERRVTASLSNSSTTAQSITRTGIPSVRQDVEDSLEIRDSDNLLDYCPGIRSSTNSNAGVILSDLDNTRHLLQKVPSHPIHQTPTRRKNLFSDSYSTSTSKDTKITFFSPSKVSPFPRRTYFLESSERGRCSPEPVYTRCGLHQLADIADMAKSDISAVKQNMPEQYPDQTEDGLPIDSATSRFSSPAAYLSSSLPPSSPPASEAQISPLVHGKDLPVTKAIPLTDVMNITTEPQVDMECLGLQGIESHKSLKSTVAGVSHLKDDVPVTVPAVTTISFSAPTPESTLDTIDANNDTDAGDDEKQPSVSPSRNNNTKSDSVVVTLDITESASRISECNPCLSKPPPAVVLRDSQPTSVTADVVPVVPRSAVSTLRASSKELTARINNKAKTKFVSTAPPIASSAPRVTVTVVKRMRPVPTAQRTISESLPSKGVSSSIRGKQQENFKTKITEVLHLQSLPSKRHQRTFSEDKALEGSPRKKLRTIIEEDETNTKSKFLPSSLAEAISTSFKDSDASRTECSATVPAKRKTFDEIPSPEISKVSRRSALMSPDHLPAPPSAPSASLFTSSKRVRPAAAVAEILIPSKETSPVLSTANRTWVDKNWVNAVAAAYGSPRPLSRVSRKTVAAEMTTDRASSSDEDDDKPRSFKTKSPRSMAKRMVIESDSEEDDNEIEEEVTLRQRVESELQESESEISSDSEEHVENRQPSKLHKTNPSASAMDLSSDSELTDPDESDEDTESEEEEDEEEEILTKKPAVAKPASKLQKPKSSFFSSSAFDLELVGIIVETMSLSRSSSHLASSLYRTVRETRNGIFAKLMKANSAHFDAVTEKLRSKGLFGHTSGNPEQSGRRGRSKRGTAINEEGGTTGMSEADIVWVSEFERVMIESSTKCGMFGMVESSFRNDPRDLPLPFSSRFFYVPDCDPDTERAQLIKLTMPGSGKRSETKKYKQYYWKPVGK